MKKFFTAITLFLIVSGYSVFANEAHSAAARGDFGILIKISRQDKEQLKQKDTYGWTPLHYAVASDNYWICRWLIIQGADINARENDGKTPFYLAVEKKNQKILNLLTDNKAEINTPDRYGKTPLHEAVSYTDYDTATFLLKSGADINVRNRNGETPLIIAINNNNFGMVSFLVDHGADFLSKNDAGKTPLFYAYTKNNVGIINYLKLKKAEISEKEIDSAHLQGCMSNMKNIATALEMFYVDNKHYPESLQELVPNYMHYIPACPATGGQTYMSTYKKSNDGKNYSFYCQGKNHTKAGMPDNYPKYNDTQGIIKPTAQESSRPF